MPIDWNNINEEDSSVSGCESAHQLEQFQPQTPKLSKIVSDSQALSNKHKSKPSTNEISELNLQKLSALETQQVWLFVPKSLKNDNTEETYKIIKEISNVKKLIQNSGGWNIKVSSKLEAKKLIQFGYRKNKVNLKFYVSTKNYDMKSPSKLSRKGSTSESNQKDGAINESPRKQRKIRFEDENGKKKSRYFEKRTDFKNKDSKIVVENQPNIIQKQDTIVQNEAEKQILINIRNDDEKGLNQAYQAYSQDKIDNESCPTGSTSQNPTQKQIKQSGRQEQSEDIIETQKLQPQQSSQNESQGQAKKQIQNLQPEEDKIEQGYDSEESLERMKKALKRKNKKLNKKKVNGNSQSNTVDLNNPFSLLGQC